MEHASFLSFYVTLYRCASCPDFAAINHTRWIGAYLLSESFGRLFSGVICPNGGNTVAMTVEGRERYPISVRYTRAFRTDLDSLKCVCADAERCSGADFLVGRHQQSDRTCRLEVCGMTTLAE